MCLRPMASPISKTVNISDLSVAIGASIMPVRGRYTTFNNRLKPKTVGR